MEYFDFVMLTETFVGNSFDMSGVFCLFLFFSVIMSDMLVVLSSCRTKRDDRETLQ